MLVHHLLGWWLLLKTGSVPRESRVLLFFPNLPIRLDDSGRPFWSAGPTTKLMGWLFARLRNEVESGNLVLGVETHAMRRALEGLIQMPVTYLPHPVEFHTETRRRGGVESSEFLTTEDTEAKFVQKQGAAWSSQAGASESDSLASKLADSPVSESRNRAAIGPAAALDSGRLTLDSKTSAEPIVFGCYGAARWEKGSDVFLKAIKLILKNEVASDKWRVTSGENQFLPDTSYPLLVTADGRPLRFAIQWVEDFRDGEGNWVSIDPWLKNHPQVEVIARYFEGGEYEQRLAETDVMVLPYRSPYRLRVSRVVIEAMLNGMPVIATNGTTLFEQAEEYGVAVGCEEGSAESLARAILELAEDFAAMRNEAKQKAKKAAESFSMGYFREFLAGNRK
jgi:glycosyltransferase involved in cell wall biosynthesis